MCRRQDLLLPDGVLRFALTLSVATAVACGGRVETRALSGEGQDDASERYLDAIVDADGLQSCQELADAPRPEELPYHHADHWDGGCYVELDEFEGSRWTTVCQGTSCHCLLDGEPLCACETEVAWCEIPSASCCPSPWP